MDGHESPLKAWVRKHSPIKSRHNSNKPLPPPPPQDQNGSPKRIPISTISGNVNNGPVGAQQKTKKRISSLLKHKSSASAALPASFQSRPITPAAQPVTGRSQSAAGFHEHARKSSRPPLQRSLSQESRTPQSSVQRRSSRTQAHSPTLRTLTDRVSSLESQLRAARAEIASVSQGSSTNPSSPRRALPIEGELLNREAEERCARLQGKGHYAGLVESLLEPTYAAASASASRRSMSVDRESALAAYREAEWAYDEDNEEKQYTRHRVESNHFGEARVLARRRSEIRAASWKQVQEHMAAVQNEHHHSIASSSKKRSRSHEIPRSQLVVDETIKGQPPARRQKHSHEGGLPGRTSNERERDRNSNQRQFQSDDGARATAPPRQPYYTGEQAKAHEDQLQSPSPKSGHKRRPSEGAIPKPQFTVKAVSDVERTRTTQESKVGNAHGKEGDEKDDMMIDLDDAGDGAGNLPGEGTQEGPPSPHRRHVPSPSRLHTVDEEFEWNDEEIF